MKLFVILLMAILSWSACIGLDVNDLGDNCDFSDDIRSSLPAQNVSTIRINAAAGDLVIRQHDADAVDIYGFACASSRSDLDRINLVTEVDSGEIQITADLSRVRNNASLDLSLKVPRHARLIITDSSGDILIENIANDIYLEDGSGNTQIYDVTGWVKMTDGSGNIVMKNIYDNVTIEADGSGNISISNVDGDVYIGEDGSGNIVVTNVSGDFSVGHDDSGNVSYSNIAGQVNLP